MIGHPTIGDLLYGQKNKSEEGLQLVALGIKFDCPFGNDSINIKIDPNRLPI
jgi:23S rRNA-/tRNA-specific pseudouridylate synthase